MSKGLISGEEIANNIRAERSRAKLTQQQVAKELGIASQTYISYESNAKCIKAKMLYHLAHIFNCEVTSFYLRNNSTKCRI